MRLVIPSLDRFRALVLKQTTLSACDNIRFRPPFEDLPWVSQLFLPCIHSVQKYVVRIPHGGPAKGPVIRIPASYIF
jgi:hypothetical protein